MARMRSAPLALLLLMLPGLAAAEDGEDERNFDVTGFLLGVFSGRTTGQRPGGREGGDFLLAEERLRLDLSAWSEPIEASARVKADFFHDAVAREFAFDLREAYIDYTTGSFDFRLGRQIATWGVGDLLFVNDVFPKDWVSFFSGRPLEYLKIGVDALRTSYSSDVLNADLFIIPFFTPDNVPTPERFFLFDPFEGVPVREEQFPDQTYGNTEFALRIYRQIGDVDVSLYAYRGFWRTPSVRPDSISAPTRVTAFYPSLSVYGFSAQASALKGVVSLEAGYYDSRGDENGDDPAVPNSQVRFLLGYQTQPWKDATFGVQYYGEIMADYSAYRMSLPPGFPAQKEYRDTITVRLDQRLKHGAWWLSLFTFYSPADGDYLVRPQVSYRFSDDLSATLGANIFGGEKGTTALGQLDRNDNVFFQVRFDF
jgi:hypothetical protein